MSLYLGDFRDLKGPVDPAGLPGRSADEIDRIYSPPVLQDLEVQVRTGRAAGFAHQGNGLTLLHLVADSDEIFRIMRIPRRIAVTVVDLDHQPVAIAFGGPRHHAVRDRHDRVAGARQRRLVLVDDLSRAAFGVEIPLSIITTLIGAPFFLMQGAIKLMIREGTQGSIVNIGSTSSRAGQPFLAPYSTSKGALSTLTRHAGYALMRGVHIRADFIYRTWSVERQMTVDSFLYLAFTADSSWV